MSGDEKKLGAAQWAALREAVKGLKDKRVRTVLLASSLPLVLMAPQAASGAALVVDDIEGMYVVALQRSARRLAHELLPHT